MEMLTRAVFGHALWNVTNYASISSNSSTTTLKSTEKQLQLVMDGGTYCYPRTQKVEDRESKSAQWALGSIP